jgi:ADP-ribose pyrophosphatase
MQLNRSSMREMWRLPTTTLKPWTLLDAVRVGSFGIFDVMRSMARDAAGLMRKPVVTMETSNWCNVIALTASGDVVLVRQFRFGAQAICLEIPGGVIDPGELPEVAARRELREETGYGAGELELLSVLSPNPALAANRLYSFVARNVVASANTAFDDLEELETVLVPHRELATLLDQGCISHALCAVALEQFLRRFPAPAGP